MAGNVLDSVSVAQRTLSSLFAQVVKQNADVNDVDYTNHTALHYAAAGGKETLLIYLLDNGARITQSNNGNTPLHVVSVAESSGEKTVARTVPEQRLRAIVESRFCVRASSTVTQGHGLHVFFLSFFLCLN